jgi:enoyl-CoA hydratase/carnithine racemase
MTLDATPVVEMAEEKSWWQVTIARPPENRLDPGLMRTLRQAILDADAREDEKAIVITGKGDVFCGGLDIAQIRAGADPREFAAALVDLLRVLPRLGKPVIAALNGDALASGYSIACAADIAICVAGSRVGTMETASGIWPMIAQVPALHRLAPRHALENLLTGEPYDAERAREIGAVNEVVAREKLWERVQHWSALSTRGGPAVRAGRQSFYRFLDMSYEAALDASLEEFRRMFED